MEVNVAVDTEAIRKDFMDEVFTVWCESKHEMEEAVLFLNYCGVPCDHYSDTQSIVSGRPYDDVWNGIFFVPDEGMMMYGQTLERRPHDPARYVYSLEELYNRYAARTEDDMEVEDGGLASFI